MYQYIIPTLLAVQVEKARMYMSFIQIRFPDSDFTSPLSTLRIPFDTSVE